MSTGVSDRSAARIEPPDRREAPPDDRLREIRDRDRPGGAWISHRSIQAADSHGVAAVHLPCGERVIVRPARPRDAGMIQTYIQALSPAARHNRFLGSLNELSANELYRMTHADSCARPETLLAEKVENGGRIMIGEARYALLPAGLGCEFAVSVAEAWRRKELGTLLIGIVACRAKALGARYLAGDVFRSNEPMLKLTRTSGFTRTEPVTGAGLVRVTKDLSLVNAAQPCGTRLADSWMIAA